jgi:hypothetical protein
MLKFKDMKLVIRLVQLALVLNAIVGVYIISFNKTIHAFSSQPQESAARLIVRVVVSLIVVYLLQRYLEHTHTVGKRKKASTVRFVALSGAALVIAWIVGSLIAFGVVFFLVDTFITSL